MTAWVHDYVAYDISVFGKNMPSDWVLANRRGVCVEFSNLLVALLRSKDIATRYVNGYALSNEYKGFLTHEWVEVLAGGKWVSFDPTWLEGGLLDATHVVTSRSTDGIEKETLSYFGNGNINWSKGFDAVRMTDYSSNNDTSISIDAPQNLPVEGGGYLKATLSYAGCEMDQLQVSSCVGSGDRGLLDIRGGARKIWFCGSGSVFWVFTNSLPSGYTYRCPVQAYDQTNNQADITISIGGTSKGPAPSISGPDSAGVNRPFTIQASHGMLFSTELGEAPSNNWSITIREPGSYDFYAYSNGMLAQKTVKVSAYEEFELMASTQENVNQSSIFIITVSLKNIGTIAKAATVKVVFANQAQEQQASLDAGQTKLFSFNFTAYDSGTARYTASALSDSYTGYSGSIDVIPTPSGPKGVLESLAAAIQSFIDWLMDLFNRAP
jgi:hypothetical protein